MYNVRSARRAHRGVLVGHHEPLVAIASKHQTEHAALVDGGTVVVAAMAWSRIYLGAHWLTDTVGGALLGSGIGLLCCGLGYLLRQRFRVRPE